LLIKLVRKEKGKIALRVQTLLHRGNSGQLMETAYDKLCSV